MVDTFKWIPYKLNVIMIDENMAEYHGAIIFFNVKNSVFLRFRLKKWPWINHSLFFLNGWIIVC